MKSIKKNNNRSKGSVLIAVIGILAVLSVMALRFNVEMETAMIKTTGKNLSSDVKVLANSGLKYCIAKILESGQLFGTPSQAARTQLTIEENMEMQINVNPTLNKIGTGVADVVARFNANSFYGGDNSTLSAGYIPDDKNLAPGNVNFKIEDLSAMLPGGHVSQWYQRHLVSSILCHMLCGKVPSNATVPVETELFENPVGTPSNDSKVYDGTVLVRSMLPYEVAKATPNQLNTPGLPLADGIITPEELGSSYTWIKGTVSEAAKKIATDYPRSTKDYRLLSGALTPFSRFVHDENFQDVSYASINPLVMSRQNYSLYNSFFYYDPNDLQLKRNFSVSFPPVSIAKDDNGAKNAAMVKPDFFEANNDAALMITTGMPVMTINSTSTQWTGISATYNARNDAADLHTSTLLPAISPEKVKTWSDAEITTVPDEKTAYYLAMDKAVERLSRTFKGTGVHKWPAENMMCPIVTRKTLELAIVSAVFGDAIVFVDDTNDKLFFDGGVVDYLRLYKAIESGAIDFGNIKFVENAFIKQDADDSSSPKMSKDYFVPFWAQYNVGQNGAKFAVAGDANIKVPAMGLYKDGGTYVNYLPHPQTDQSKLDQVFVTVAAAYSHKHLSTVRDKSNNALSVNKLYTGAAVGGFKCKMNAADANDAWLDLSGPTVKNTVAGGDYFYLNYVSLDGTGKVDDVNFKPADFTPYETRIRMAVLVNLLNAIIPPDITKTDNSVDANLSFFSTAAVGNATTLEDFIRLENKQYKVSSNALMPPYLGGWVGGIQTPGMTFWKFGVHSTTFLITVDAFKYDDSARLSTVVTFDNYVLASVVGVGPAATGTYNKAKPKYDLDTFDKKMAVTSNIYLNPLGRADGKSNTFSIGSGDMRYPTDANTDSWTILSSVWSSAFGRNGQEVNDYFVPILLFPADVVNIGPDGGSWHFVPHAMEPAPFDKFFTDVNGNTSLGRLSVNDYSTGALVTPRTRGYGGGSWIKWKATFTKSMAANKLDIILNRNGANANSGYTQNHTVTITRRSNNQVMCVVPFATKSDWGYQTNYVKQIPVAVEAGEYDVTLTETNDSSTNGYGDEIFLKLTIVGN